MLAKPRILICIPAYKMVPPESFFYHLCFAMTCGRSDVYELYMPRFITPTGDVNLMRNLTVEQALKGDADYVLFIDDDMCIPPECDLVRTLLGHETDIVGPLFYRAGNHACVFEESVEGQISTITDVPDTPFQCAAIGTGVMLVSTKVFRELEKPWFYQNPDLKHSRDVVFCTNARLAGFKVWCDPRLKIPQLGARTIIAPWQ